MQKDIKIFVSHRIDIKSELVNNPLFHQVRCGAVYDTENLLDILGDDTCDNISDKRLSLCEFTVQYWAWKNVQADYYGLCHYRRFLSFSGKRFRTDDYNVIFRQILLPFSAKKFCIDMPDKMQKMIEPYDIVASEPADVRKILSPEGRKDTVKELWLAHKNLYFEEHIICMLFELIDELHPEFSNSAREYFDGSYHRGFNCYVMKKDHFFRMCQFQFDIMFEAEKRLDTTEYTTTMLRTPAFMGEMLYGVYVYHVTHHENASINELQLVFFSDTDSTHSVARRAIKSFFYWLVHLMGRVSLVFFPLWSRRRERLKKIAYSIFRIRNRGAAEPKK